MTVSFQVQQIDHVELFVPDIETAKEWYRVVLGLVPVEKAKLWADEGQPHMISSDGGNTMLALFQGDGPEGRETIGHHLVAFRVDATGFIDFLDHIEQVKVASRHGGRLTRGEVVDHDLAWSIYFRDPWGNNYEITSYDYDEINRSLTGT